jgi:hypothetical protein
VGSPPSSSREAAHLADSISRIRLVSFERAFSREKATRRKRPTVTQFSGVLKVMPAQAGTQKFLKPRGANNWVPACAGMTNDPDCDSLNPHL